MTRKQSLSSHVFFRYGLACVKSTSPAGPGCRPARSQRFAYCEDARHQKAPIYTLVWAPTADSNNLPDHRSESGPQPRFIMHQEKLQLTNGSGCEKKPFVVGICGGKSAGKTTMDKIGERIANLALTHVTINSDTIKTVGSSDRLFETLARTRSKGKLPIAANGDKNGKVASADLVVDEGTNAFHLKEIRDMMDLKIFIEADSETRLARMLGNGEDVQCRIQLYFDQKQVFETFVQPTRKYADVVIPGGGENLEAINLVVNYIKCKTIKKN